MESQQPTTLKTRNGHEKVVYQNYRFIFDKYIAEGTQKAWRCEFKTRGCKARIWTDLLDNVLSERVGKEIVHSHPQPLGLCGGQELKQEIAGEEMQLGLSAVVLGQRNPSQVELINVKPEGSECSASVSPAVGAFNQIDPQVTVQNRHELLDQPGSSNSMNHQVQQQQQKAAKRQRMVEPEQMPLTASTPPAVSHILVWTAVSHMRKSQTYIMVNVMDDQVPVGLDYPQEASEPLPLSLSTLLQQKLMAQPVEVNDCCYGTKLPVNIVLNEFSNLGYRAIGMVNKQPGEILWTLAKNS